MPEDYLTLSDIADRVGLTVGAVRQLHKRSAARRERGVGSARDDLPPEDIRLGHTPGWHTTSIAGWLKQRKNDD